MPFKELTQAELNCPLNKDRCDCPCPEYSKELLCDYPFMNSESEIKAVKEWGYRIPVIKESDKGDCSN